MDCFGDSYRIFRACSFDQFLISDFWSDQSQSQPTVWSWFGQSALRIFLMTFDLQTKVTKMKKPRNRFKLSINLERDVFLETFTYKGRIEGIREQLYLKNISSSSFISRQLGWLLWTICYLNSIEIEILISSKQIGFLVFSSAELSMLCCFTCEVCSGSWRTSRGSRGSETSWHRAHGWTNPGENYS